MSNLSWEAVKEGFREMKAGKVMSRRVPLEGVSTIYGMGSHRKEKILEGGESLRRSMTKRRAGRRELGHQTRC